MSDSEASPSKPDGLKLQAGEWLKIGVVIVSTLGTMITFHMRWYDSVNEKLTVLSLKVEHVSAQLLEYKINHDREMEKIDSRVRTLERYGFGASPK